ncbi:MAG TPA: hypothetical protein VHK00_01770 [Miltoncostaeaceae bacterium]|nr:hypothetical protein [Miltoncostaeaceae bacterium]
MNPERTLQPGPWLKTPGWRGGAFLIGLTVLVLFADWITGDLFDVGWWGRPTLVVILGFLLSVPYGWAWMHGKAPLPPTPAVLVPQAAVQGDERGNTYVLVGPDRAVTRPGLGRRSRDLGAIGWLFYTVFWRWPLVIGDAVLTVVWRGIVRVFGANGGPRVEDVSARQQEVDYPEDLSPPDRERF